MIPQPDISFSLQTPLPPLQSASPSPPNGRERRIPEPLSGCWLRAWQQQHTYAACFPALVIVGFLHRCVSPHFPPHKTNLLGWFAWRDAPRGCSSHRSTSRMWTLLSALMPTLLDILPVRPAIWPFHPSLISSLIASVTSPLRPWHQTPTTRRRGAGLPARTRSATSGGDR